MKNNFEQFYEIIKARQEELNSFYDLLQNNNDEKKERFIEKLLNISSLEDDKENRLALISRVVNLRDDTLIQALKQAQKSDEEIKKIGLEIYEAVKTYHLEIQKQTIQNLENSQLLSDFYMVLVKGVYDVGVILSDIWVDWKQHIIQDINENLVKQYGDKVYEFLEKNSLFESFEDGTKADRAYSALFKKNDTYISLPYIKAFDKMYKVVKRLDELIKDLNRHEDEEFCQKEAYLNYFLTLKNAFNQNDKRRLLSSWKEVDRAWMKVTSPIQVGHPLEYYEDHLRNAVALEWDIRLDDVKRVKNSSVKDDILKMYEDVYKKIQKDLKVYNKCVTNVQKVSLHVGRPAFYFAAEFDGLFSAQVVPNDEEVSKKYGKKIFAFADNIYQSAKAKPFLKIHTDVFGKEFLDEGREILFHNPTLWHKIYEVSTIGHEFGHILWLDENSEMLMNKSGMFKNIEEFKATTGGLMAFFYNEKEELKRPLMMDLIKRAVGLIGWMKTSEVEPYYCEGLIHLKGLFETEVLSFKNSLKIDITSKSYERVKKWYFKTYENLARHYLSSLDAKEFLDIYAKKDEAGYFMPVDLNIKYFVNYYWNLHEQIGRIIDCNEDRSKWI